MAQRKVILLVSGEISAGKSTLSKTLEERFDFKVLKTRDCLRQLGATESTDVEPERDFLQKLGEKLDNEQDGRWVLNCFQDRFGREFDMHNFYVVDAIRAFNQIEHFRSIYKASVFHVHLMAAPQCLHDRFIAREEFAHISVAEAKQRYYTAKSDYTEQRVAKLSTDADLVINTDLCSKDDVFIRVASFFKLLAPTKNELVDVIVGGQFGSEGKGQVAAHIAPEYDCLIRVGGPNAGHTVFEYPKKHVFHLLPSGTYRNQKAKIILGPGTIVNVDKLLHEINEYAALDRFSKRVVIDENAVFITQDDIDREQKLMHKIGSTGQGVGFATANNILARLHGDERHKVRNHPKLKGYIGSSLDVLEEMYRQNKRILLEGTQGSGLSVHHGTYPFVTSRDTTVSGCLSESGISPKRVKNIVMVTRSYPIRVGGTSGPFGSQEIDMSVIAKRSGKDAGELIKNEKTTTTKKDRRIAEFSWTMFRKACELNSPTDIALTFTDYLSRKNENARTYDKLTPETRQFIEELERCSGVKVSLIGIGFDYRAIIDRRNWK